MRNEIQMWVLLGDLLLLQASVGQGGGGSRLRGSFRALASPTSGRLGRMSDVTHLLEAAAAGDHQAAAKLLPLVYDELRKLAPRAWPRSGRTTPSTSLPWSTRHTCGSSA